MSIPNIDPSTFSFTNFTIAFYNGQNPYENGQLTSTGQALLSGFEAYLKTVPQPDSGTWTKDQLDSLYMTYLSGQFAASNVSGASNALSPEEIAARQTIFAVYKMCIQMLQALQGTMMTQGNLLNIYTKIQSSYTNMFSQIPIYGPEDSNHIIVNNDNFGASTLGYANLTIQQIVQNLLPQITTTASTDPATGIVTTTVLNPYDQTITTATTNPTHPLYEATTTVEKFSYNASADTTTVTTTVTTPLGVIRHTVETFSGLIRTVVTASSAQWSTPQSGDPFNATASGPLIVSVTQAGSDFTVQIKIGNGWTVSLPSSVLISGTASSTQGLTGQAMIANLISALTTSLSYNWKNLLLSSSSLSFTAPNATTTINLSPTQLAQWWSGQNPHSSYNQYTDPNNPTNYWSYMLTTGVWGPEALAWPETLGSFKDSGKSAADINTLRNQEYSYRSEVNAKLQLLLTTAQSKSSTIGSYSQQTQNIITQTQQAIQGQADLMKSIVDSLTTLVSALFP